MSSRNVRTGGAGVGVASVTIVIVIGYARYINALALGDSVVRIQVEIIQGDPSGTKTAAPVEIVVRHGHRKR